DVQHARTDATSASNWFAEERRGRSRAPRFQASRPPDAEQKDWQKTGSAAISHLQAQPDEMRACGTIPKLTRVDDSVWWFFSWREVSGGASRPWRLTGRLSQ